jgi:tetratricopeptide (TPR) repeat protein
MPYDLLTPAVSEGPEMWQLFKCHRVSETFCSLGVNTIRMRRIALLLLISFGTVAAQVQTPNTSARLDKLRAEGYEALFNLDYDGARKRFREMIQLAPDNPAGPQCFAASLWVEQLNQSWELKATLYSTKAYTEGQRKSDPAQAAEFRKWIRQTKTLAQAKLKQNPRDVEALYFLGAAEGLDAAYAAAVEKKYRAALSNGSDAVDRHKQVLELVPDFHDAELTIGLQNYIVGSLPLPLKMIAGTMGVRGSKKRGLETLERVSLEGHWARDLARVLLVDLYKREKRWKDAIATARVLSEKYPRNYLFKLQMADALASQIVTLRKAKDATATAGEAEEKELLRIFDSLVHDKTLDASTSELVKFRYREARDALTQPPEKTRVRSKD